MNRPILLDAYCGAGGAARGYQRAGFCVVGVDKDPQPNYAGDEFIRADAIEYLMDHAADYHAVHASPPCQASSSLTKGTNKGREYVNLIPTTRALLAYLNTPTVIENVQGSDLRRDLTLCGEMFGLGVIRHRYFEVSGFEFTQPEHIKHRGRVRGWRHGVFHDGPYCAPYGRGGGKGTLEEWKQAMDVPWMQTHHEVTECIPPAYTELVGNQIMAHLKAIGVADRSGSVSSCTTTELAS